MSLGVGDRIAHYNVTALIGEGGMGQVYQATDTKLNRQVSLKILPEAFATDPDRLARFQREAQVLASLNHPGIAAIYGIEEQDDTRALVLELVEGPTLADRISKGPIPLDEALPIAKQIAEALEAAHEAGVIHRDLKPANIKVREDGTVKVLDFGLAKALDPSPDTDPSQSPTLTAAATQMGVIMGTAAYMSPEQASGTPIDRSADVWSFGVVLFEMLTGQPLFDGATVSHVLASVLKTDPGWTTLPKQTPPSLHRLLRRCLDRNPKQRLRDIREVRISLEEAATAPPVVDVAATRPTAQLAIWQRPLPAAIGVIATVVVSVLLAWTLTRPDASVPGGVTHFAEPIEGGHDMFGGQCPGLALSPDGRTLAYVASGRLHIRRLDRLESVAVAGTEGAENPFFSPDGRLIAFGQAGAVRSVSVDGGPVTEIAGARVSSEFPCPGGSWSPDGTIVYRPDGSTVLLRIPAVGGTPVPLTTIVDPAVETFHVWPQLLDDGRRVLFTIIGPSGVWGDAQVVIEDLETGERTTVVSQGTYGRYVPPGYVVYATASGTLLAAPFDLARGERTGDAFPVASGVRVAGWGGAASFAVSQAGTAAFVHGSTETRLVLWWVDREGRRVRQIGPPVSSYQLDLSPDGQRLAVDIQLPRNGDVWLIDTRTAEQEPDRLTFNEGFDQYPAWSPDGRQLAYATFGSGGESGATIEVQEVDGGSAAETVYRAESDTDLFVYSWSTDGWLAFTEGGADSINAYAVHIGEPEKRIPLAVTSASETFPQFSPDGRWLAYDSNESGRPEVYVVSFPEIDRRQQVSTEGGASPRWSTDSGELFFWSGTTLMTSTVSTGESFSSQAPRPLFEAADRDLTQLYDVSPDGEHFVVAVKNPEALAPEIHIVENWFQELERLRPKN